MAKALLKTKETIEPPKKETLKLLQALVGEDKVFNVDWDEVERWAEEAREYRKSTFGSEVQ